ncbi:MAG: MCE family protein [Myxococcales bacterium]|nr:MAG: MCE family protein [Myxococcales bacterium]
MSAEAYKFKVGLFVVGGAALMAVALIWLGASKFFSATNDYVTYINESVQGLDVGSAVKFMGVSVGTTTEIKIAPDGQLVEVRMELQKSFRREPDMLVELAMAGITGMKFIEITRDAEAKLVPLTFPPAGDYIPAKISATQKIFDALSSISDKLMQVDFEGISNETKKTLKTIGDAAERLKYLLAKSETEKSIDEAAATLDEIKALVQSVREEVAGTDMKGTIKEIRQTVFNFNQIFERVDDEVTATLINLRQTTANLSRITERIGQDPAQLFLGLPAPERGGAPKKEDAR